MRSQMQEALQTSKRKQIKKKPKKTTFSYIIIKLLQFYYGHLINSQRKKQIKGAKIKPTFFLKKKLEAKSNGMYLQNDKIQ